MPTIDDIVQLLETCGDSQYGGERVTQLEHALQSATLAEEEGASPELIVAALLHDVGHLLHDLPVDAPDGGIDDHHETCGYHFVRKLFPQRVAEPIRLHVTAKRYLCKVDAKYLDELSQPSIVSLKLQGGPMTEEEVDRFDRNPFAQDAVRLRRWDDTAKVPDFATPALTHFTLYLRQVAVKDSDA